MQELFNLLNGYNAILPELQAYLFKCLKVRKLPANSHWLKEGETCNKIAFVEEGLLKIYHHYLEKEYITWFNKENDIIISVESFFTQTASVDGIRTLAPTVLRYIEYKDLEYAYTQYKDFNINGRKIAQYYYGICERHLRMLMYPARERYIALLQHFPWMDERVPDKYLAAYLGIAPQTLSTYKSEWKDH